MNTAKIASIILGFVIDALLVITLGDEVRRRIKEAKTQKEMSASATQATGEESA